MEQALNYEHRLTEVEQRSKSNQHRIEGLEPIVKEIRTMSNTMVQLVQEVKHTNETVKNIDTKVERMDIRVNEMEKAPGKKASAMKEKIIGAIYGAVVAFFITGILWASAQAFIGGF